MPNYRDQITMRTSLDAQHAKAIVGIVEGNPLHESREHLPFRLFQ
jgi:hypothetical protein